MKLFFLISRKKRKKPNRKTPGHKKYLAYKEAARALVHHRLEHFSEHYKISYKKIFIKNQKTRWGSCSKSGNLNFNYKIVFLTPDEQDYIIVHELCHLIEFNHSKNFWALVAQAVPNYAQLRAGLRKFKL